MVQNPASTSVLHRSRKAITGRSWVVHLWLVQPNKQTDVCARGRRALLEALDLVLIQHCASCKSSANDCPWNGWNGSELILNRVGESLIHDFLGRWTRAWRCERVVKALPRPQRTSWMIASWTLGISDEGSKELNFLGGPQSVLVNVGVHCLEFRFLAVQTGAQGESN